MVKKNRRIVVIGGGTGSSVVLKGLKRYNVDIATIVPMTDSGGSTGKLREQFGVLATGEIRQRLIALAGEDEISKLLAKLLDYRFEKGELAGHNFGNIFLVALTELLGSEKKAIEAASKILKIKGRIIPSTFDNVELVAEYSDGRKVVGEHFIDEPEKDGKIIKLYTEPEAKANVEAIKAIKNADLIVIGPGDLYTSILANFVVKGISEAVVKSKAKKVYICNLMTSFGETIGMNVQDHINEIEKYIGEKVLDYVIVNTGKIPEYAIVAGRKEPVKIFIDEKTKKRIKVIAKNLLSKKIYVKPKADVLERSMILHDPKKLGKILYSLKI
jgi:uncharacterized cofD-like protein